jgi:hypothetical protein
MAALGKVVEALKGFTVPDQERIIRSARTMLGLPVAPHVGGDGEHPPARETQQHLPGRDLGRSPDIKAFIDSKRPTSDTQFAATVAYYHQFEAPETQRKTTIDAEDLQDAARKSNRGRFNKPAQTLVNTHQQGYLDKGAERGTYVLNAVGENLVAMTLPSSATETPVRRPGRRGAKRRTNAKLRRRSNRKT